MSLDFRMLPMSDKMYILERITLPEDETMILTLKYVFEFSYSRIAAEMNISEKSVGPMLTKARKDTVTVAKECAEIEDDKTKAIIKILGWDMLDWPTMKNRRA